MVKESSIQTAWIAKLRKDGAYVINNHGSAFTSRGVADLTVCMDGQFCAIELKTPVGKVAAAQLLHLYNADKSGAYSFLTNSTASYDTFKRYLDGDDIDIHVPIRQSDITVEHAKVVSDLLKKSKYGILRIISQ